MKTLWQPQAREELDARLARLTPSHMPQWGRMSAKQMLAHLTDAMRMATGELKTARKNVPIRYPPLKQLVVYYLPWPKGAPTAPELLARECDDWTCEVQDLRAAVQRFANLDPDARLPEHPAFGRLSRRAWGRLTYRHIDHHLRQFGV
jgi:hypothetical protein